MIASLILRVVAPSSVPYAFLHATSPDPSSSTSSRGLPPPISLSNPPHTHTHLFPLLVL